VLQLWPVALSHFHPEVTQHVSSPTPSHPHSHSNLLQVEAVLQLWPVALSHTPLLLELTRLMANSLAACPEARLAAATLTGEPCLRPDWGWGWGEQ
jgi:hypothetical protein